jgi:Kae1-associated kinase Bud32
MTTKTPAAGPTQGAEALLQPDEHFGRAVLAKRRVAKPYRDARLDARLRDGRTRDEGHLLLSARRAGVAVPVVYDIDRAGATVVLEPIAGRTLRDALMSDTDAAAAQRFGELGRTVRRLHGAGLAHGDLTTSNVLVPDAGGALVLIDFGLGSFTEEPEERGVDLHNLEEALEATDARAGALFAAFLDGYGTDVLAAAARRRLEAIRERGRYR